MYRLSACHQGFIVASSVTSIPWDAWKGDGIQVGLAQPLASMPLSATSILSPGWGEGAGQANRGCQGGGTAGSLTLTILLSLPTSDGSVRGAHI